MAGLKKFSIQMIQLKNRFRQNPFFFKLQWLSFRLKGYQKSPPVRGILHGILHSLLNNTEQSNISLGVSNKSLICPEILNE